MRIGFINAVFRYRYFIVPRLNVSLLREGPCCYRIVARIIVHIDRGFGVTENN